MAKTEFNTLIETLKIFLVPVVAAVHERTLSSQQWRPGGAWRGIGPADLRDGCKIQCPSDRSNRTLFRSLSRWRPRAGSITRTTPLVRSSQRNHRPQGCQAFGYEPKVGPFHERFRRKHWVFVRFVSVRLSRIPRRVLRFYYATQEPKWAFANWLIERDLAPRARFELATLRLTALPEPRQIEGIQQAMIKWSQLRLTFSFQFSLPFAAIHHHSHDTYMTPRILAASN
jgi:hypothetical protein